ncbi:MAG: ABC transporter ATP-binding protein [Ardenticatenaceae bacterium]|nr:ABC transporter ATP-binding protein [Ardenticatenaceae bacterium]MCB9444644.1 ABC transporter ATP-binding protein [Ardenticatenaceae bacterium]
MNNFRRLLSFITPYRRRFALSATLATMSISADLLVPTIFGWTISRGLQSGELKRVAFYVGLLVLAQAMRSTVNYLQWTVQHQVGQNVVRDLRNQIYAKLQALPTSFYRDMPTGQIMSRVTSDVEAVQEYLGWGFLIQGMAALAFTGTSIILFVMDWQLTLVLYLPLVVLVFIVYNFNKRIGPSWEAVREQMGKLTAVLQENISGIRVVKAFAQEKLEYGRFREQNAINRAKNLDRQRLEANSFPAMDLMVGLTFALLAWFGAQRVLSGQGDLGRFFAYQWYLWGIIWPVRFMGWLISMMRQALAAAPRLFQILDAPLVIEDDPDAVELDGVRGEIEFRDVHFAFDDEPDRYVMQGLNLHVKPGEIVAVMGGTGSGKSSLVNLIGRFQEATEGQVLVDGRNVRDLTLDSLRRHIGIVPQEAFLFSATVGENIAYGNPNATPDEIIAAAKLAQAHEFIMEMPKGYDTQIGERGVRLSGGQKQRLSLARAILVDPAILILDEATSAVDTRTEHEIQRALEQVMQGRTSLIIAQRLSTIKHADRIIVLKDGVVAEEGTHEELLDLGGEYAHIYDLQYRESDELEAEIHRYLREYAPTANGQATNSRPLPLAV